MLHKDATLEDVLLEFKLKLSEYEEWISYIDWEVYSTDWWWNIREYMFLWVLGKSLSEQPDKETILYLLWKDDKK